MKEIIQNNKWLFKQFTIINRTAMSVYSAIQGGVGANFYFCYLEYENGVFGWVKESAAFLTALEIYNQYTGNEAWDIVSELEDLLGEDLKNMAYEDIAEYENELMDF